MARRTKAQRAKYVQELQTEYNALRKTANRRMRALEKLAEDPEYESVLGYAYKNAAYDLRAKGLDKNRFPADIGRMAASKTNIADLKSYIAIAERFLSSPSSTKRGLNKVYTARARALNKRYGTQFTRDDMKTFFDSSIWEKWKGKLGYEAAFRSIAKVQKSPDKVLKEIAEANQAHKSVNISELANVEGRNVAKELNENDIEVLKHLAEIYRK